jgi:ribonuclease P protein subunit RPR2
MARKNKAEATPNANSVANRDILQRLNFLYQASVYLNAIGPGPSAIKPNADDDGKKKKRRQRRLISAGDLSREYVKDMKLVARKTTVRMCVPSP